MNPALAGELAAEHVINVAKKCGAREFAARILRAIEVRVPDLNEAEKRGAVLVASLIEDELAD